MRRRLLPRLYVQLHASLELNAAHPEAHLFAALCAARRHDDALALQLLTRARELAPHNAEIVRDYGALLVRMGRPAEALPWLRRAVAMLRQLYELGESSAHARGALASAHVKLSAALVGVNEHAACVRTVRAAVSLDRTLEPALAGLRELCTNAPREGRDTSGVRIEIAL